MRVNTDGEIWTDVEDGKGTGQSMVLEGPGDVGGADVVDGNFDNLEHHL
jgi:hypothetical protein